MEIENLLIFFCLIQSIHSDNKYSREANENVFNSERPFRIQKLNNIWNQAVQVIFNNVFQLIIYFKL